MKYTMIFNDTLDYRTIELKISLLAKKRISLLANV